MKLLKARIQTLKHWTTLLDDDAATFDDEFDELVVATELVDEMLPAGNCEATVHQMPTQSKRVKYGKIKLILGKNDPI